MTRGSALDSSSTRCTARPSDLRPERLLSSSGRTMSSSGRGDVVMGGSWVGVVMWRNGAAALADWAWRWAVEYAAIRYGWAYPAAHVWICLVLGMAYQRDAGWIRWSSGAARRLRWPARIALALYRAGAPVIERRWAAERQAPRIGGGPMSESGKRIFAVKVLLSESELLDLHRWAQADNCKPADMARKGLLQAMYGIFGLAERRCNRNRGDDAELRVTDFEPSGFAAQELN